MTYEITNVDTGKTVKMSKGEAEKLWGKVGFREMVKGYFANFVVVKTSSSTV